jgi:hypothetical protein
MLSPPRVEAYCLLYHPITGRPECPCARIYSRDTDLDTFCSGAEGSRQRAWRRGGAPKGGLAPCPRRSSDSVQPRNHSRTPLIHLDAMPRTLLQRPPWPPLDRPFLGHYRLTSHAIAAASARRRLPHNTGHPRGAPWRCWPPVSGEDWLCRIPLLRLNWPPAWRPRVRTTHPAAALRKWPRAASH